jgi:putative membrane protein (TIGR04086 family)
MNSMNKTVQTQSFNSVFTGLLYSFISMGIITIMVSLFLLLTSMKEESLSVLIYFIHGISLMIGGFVTGKRIEKKGWYYGGLTGVIYSLIILLVGFLGFDASMNLITLSIFILSFSSGALGGIIGVNSKK